MKAISARDAAEKLEAGAAQAIDLRSSAAWSAGHIPGFGLVRSAAYRIGGRSIARPVVLIADDVLVPRAAAVDLAEAGVAEISMLDGGIAAWQADGA